MRDDEREEIESTREWLLRIREEECSEELLYLPSELTRLSEIDRDTIVVSPMGRSGSVAVVTSEHSLLSPDCDVEEWFILMESELISVFDFEPELPEFNALVASIRARGGTELSMIESLDHEPYGLVSIGVGAAFEGGHL